MQMLSVNGRRSRTLLLTAIAVKLLSEMVNATKEQNKKRSGQYTTQNVDSNTNNKESFEAMIENHTGMSFGVAIAVGSTILAFLIVLIISSIVACCFCCCKKKRPSLSEGIQLQKIGELPNSSSGIKSVDRNQEKEIEITNQDNKVESNEKQSVFVSVSAIPVNGSGIRSSQPLPVAQLQQAIETNQDKLIQISSLKKPSKNYKNPNAPTLYPRLSPRTRKTKDVDDSQDVYC